MRVFNEECYVLRTIPFSETSLIVETFSRNYGHLNLLAKGARRSNSKFRGLLRPFQYLKLSWSGKGEVPTVTAVNECERVLETKGENFYCASYVNELIMRSLHFHDPHPKLFDICIEALDALSKSPDKSSVLRIFEKNLLKELGYALTLETEAGNSTPIQSDRRYVYKYDSGPVPLDRPEANSISGRSLLALADERLETSEVKRECKRLLGEAIEQFFDGRRLRSREIYRQTLNLPDS